MGPFLPCLCSPGDPYYSNQVADTLNSWVVGRAHTPRGLNYYTWAPNKFAASASFLALQAADLGINVQPYRRFAKSQVRLIVAEGPAQMFGEKRVNQEGKRVAD